MPTYTDQDIQDLLAEFDITVPDLSSRINAVEGKIITVATGADVTDYGQVELIAKLESDAAEGRANTYTDNQLLAAGIDILAQANSDSQSKYDAIESITKAYTDGLVTNVEEAAAITAAAKAELAELNAKAYADGIVTDSEAAQIAASEARAELAETLAKAYADGIVTDAEANAIFEAEIKAQALVDAALIAAKDYADSIVVTDSSEFGDFIEIANRDIAILNDKTTDTEVRELLLLAEDTELKYDLQASTFRVGQTESNITTLNAQSVNFTSQFTQINHSTTGILAQANNYTYAGAGRWIGNTWIEGAISQRIRDLKVTTGNGSAKLTEITEVFEDVGSGKLIARGGMVTDVKGYISGYMSTNDGSKGDFKILADNFSVGRWENNAFVPYLNVDNNKLSFKGDISGASGNFTGDISGASGNFTGDISGASGNFTGDISGATGTFTGDVEASSLLIPTANGLIQVSTTSGADGLACSMNSGGSQKGGVTLWSKGKVQIYNNLASTNEAALDISNTYGQASSHAIYVRSGAGNIENENYYLGIGTGGVNTNSGDFFSSSGDFIANTGYFRSPNTAIVNFTGGHPYLFSKSVGVNILGLLVTEKSIECKPNYSSALSYVDVTCFARDTRCVGTSSNVERLATKPTSHSLYGLTVDRELELKDTHNIAIVNAVGEGLMWVCSESGNIGQGQWLCSSSTLGHAMLQTDEETGLYEKYFTDYTVAKSREDVIWEDEPNDTKLIAVYYKGG